MNTEPEPVTTETEPENTPQAARQALKESIAFQLDLLHSLQRGLDDLNASRIERLCAGLSPEQAAILRSTASEMEEQAALITKRIDELQTGIKSAALQVLTESDKAITGQALKATYTKGRETVPIEKFRGYIVSHPEARALIKIGDPYITITKA